jgi:hypothetical protein
LLDTRVFTIINSKAIYGSLSNSFSFTLSRWIYLLYKHCFTFFSKEANLVSRSELDVLANVLRVFDK